MSTMTTSGRPAGPCAPLRLLATAGLLAAGAAAQNTVQIPLNYNFNGIVHAGEAGQPDAPNGFRSISDRALDFRGGVPNHPLLAPYRLVSVPGAFDIVHLGNRDTVDGGNWRFDPAPDGDDVGTQPSWLANPDQSTPQVTRLPTPLRIGPRSTASVIFQISNGGGSFDVTFRYATGSATTATLSGGDWFNGPFAGTQNVDRADTGNALNVVEQVVDLSGDAGESLVSIEFSNPGNPRGGYAILAVNVEEAPEPSLVHQIPLNYNFNGIVHPGESGRPDAPNGFRSIRDRALDFRAGVPNDPLLSGYRLVETAGTLDMVHLGNRDRVAGGRFAFDPAADGDDVGVRPAWLASPDQTGPQRTVLPRPILLDASSAATVLFQITDGGGLFDVTFEFGLGTQGSITSTLDGPDWLGGRHAATDRVDQGAPATAGGLRIVERRVDLSAAEGFVLTAITFSNGSNPDAAVAVLAANVVGCLACTNAGAVADLGGASAAGAVLGVDRAVPLGCEITWQVTAATPGAAAGLFGLAPSGRATPLSSILRACRDGTLHLDGGFVTAALPVDAGGRGSLTLAVPTTPGLCGTTVYTQFLEPTPQPCPVLVSNALAVTIGN